MERLADRFTQVHPGKRLEVDALQRVFASIDFKPALMKDLVKAMSAEGVTDVNRALKRFLLDDRQVAGWRALLDSQPIFERVVLVMIAQGHPPLGRDTLARLGKAPGARATIATVRGALGRLEKAGILARPREGGYRIEDRLFAEYLAGIGLKQLD